jgi:CRISPR-associated protein Cmr2
MYQRDRVVSDGYWQAKIWGLLHDLVLKWLHNNEKRSDSSCWRELRKLEVIQNWVDNKSNPEGSYRQILRHIRQADYIASASDRTAIGSRDYSNFQVNRQQP